MNGVLDGVQILESEALDQFDFLREADLAVGDAMRERGLHESTVAATRRRAHLMSVDENNVAGGVALFGDDRGP